MSDEPNIDGQPSGEKPPAEETSGLKKALQAERARANELEKQLKQIQKLEDDAKAAKERESLERKGEYEKLRAQDLARIKELEGAIEAARSKERQGLISRAALEAISQHGGIAKALEPHLLGALEAIPDGEGYKIVSAGDPSKSAADLVASWKRESDWAWAFLGSGASGSGAPPASGSTNGAKVITRSNFMQLSPAAQSAHVKAGGTVTD